MKKTFIIPCSWQMCGTYHIQAETLEQALQIADDSPLPKEYDSSFIDGSFEIDHDMIPFYNSKD